MCSNRCFENECITIKSTTMSCKPLKIKELRKQVPCQEGFRGIRNRVLITNEQLKELIQSGKVEVVDTGDEVKMTFIKEEEQP